MHVCSVGQRLRLPPKTDSLLLLLLQDETAQVGLDLEPPQTPSVSSTLVCDCVCHYSFVVLTNLLQFLLLQRLGLIGQVFKLIFLLQLLLPPLNLCKSLSLQRAQHIDCMDTGNQVKPRFDLGRTLVAGCSIGHESSLASYCKTNVCSRVCVSDQLLLDDCCVTKSDHITSC